MTRGLSTHKPFYTSLLRCLVILFCGGLVGCASPTPTPIPILTPCPASEAGIISTPTIGAPISLIFQFAATPTPDPVSQVIPVGVNPSQDHKILMARDAALHLLAYETKRWTRIKEFTLDGANRAQVAITYLSPQLLEAVFQNHILAHSPKIIDVHEVMRNDLGQIYQREESIFLVTVFASSKFSSRHTVDLTPRELVLKNANDNPVTPKHDDHNLELPINLAEGAMFGFVFYPVAVIVDGGCNEVLDRENNTKINIETKDILIDSASTGPVIWTIIYAPLAETGNSFYTPQYPDPTLTLDPKRYEPLSSPPTASESDEGFWEAFGRFVWGQITLENQ